MVMLGLDGLAIPGCRATITQGLVVDSRVIKQVIFLVTFCIYLLLAKLHFCGGTFAMVRVDLVDIYLLF